jgi:hypothetical protein
MTRRAIAVTVFVVLSAGTAAAPATSTPLPAHRVSGRLLLGGGPPRPPGSADLGPPRAEGRWQVVARRGGTTVASTTTNQDGTFAFRLKPGRYELAAKYQYPPYELCEFKSVTVKRNAVAGIRLFCSIP